MLRAATSTFQMSLNPTREQMTRGHGKRLLGRVDGSLEARHFKNFIAPRLVDFFSLEGERLGSKLSFECI